MDKFKHGGDVWHGDASQWQDFSSNMNQLETPDFIKKAISDAMDDISYYPDVSMRLATCGIAKFLKLNGENVLPTNGGIGALELILTKLKPKRVVSFTPCFVEYERIACVNEIPFFCFNILDGRDNINLDLDRLEETLKSGDMLVICNPINPIGAGFDLEIIKKILSIVERKKVLLLVDEAFIKFSCGVSLAEFACMSDDTIIAGSLTKLFSIPGVRLGYIVSNEEFINRLKNYQTPWVLSCFASGVATALDKSEDFVSKTYDANLDSKEKFKVELEKLGVKVLDSDANFLLVDLKNIGRTCDEVEVSLKQDKILVRNCKNYIGLDEYYMRVAVKKNSENEKFIMSFKKALKGV